MPAIAPAAPLPAMPPVPPAITPALPLAPAPPGVPPVAERPAKPLPPLLPPPLAPEPPDAPGVPALPAEPPAPPTACVAPPVPAPLTVCGALAGSLQASRENARTAKDCLSIRYAARQWRLRPTSVRKSSGEQGAGSLVLCSRQAEVGRWSPTWRSPLVIDARGRECRTGARARATRTKPERDGPSARLSWCKPPGPAQPEAIRARADAGRTRPPDGDRGGTASARAPRCALA